MTVKNYRTGNTSFFHLVRIEKSKMASRFVNAGSVENFILNKKTRIECTKLREMLIKLLEVFLVNKNDKRNIEDEDVPTRKLNEYVSDFIL